MSAAGRFGTCPATCAWLPANAAGMVVKIDEAYALEVARSRPRRGCGWIYTHFAADLWRDLRSRVGTVFNLSADTPIEAAAAVRAGIDAVVTVAESWWQGKRVRTVEGVPVMRCCANGSVASHAMHTSGIILPGILDVIQMKQSGGKIMQLLSDAPSYATRERAVKQVITALEAGNIEPAQWLILAQDDGRFSPCVRLTSRESWDALHFFMSRNISVI
jgi:hypothetical protein